MDSNSSWHDIIDGPILFNIYINDIFYVIKNADIANFADDNSQYVSKMNIEDVIFTLKGDSNNLNQWYTLNYLKPNTDIYRLLVCSQDTNVSVTINNENILNSKQEKLLVTIDNKFLCLPHVRNICKQASKKLHALSTICKFMTRGKSRMIMKAFDSQFSYCPLVWIFHGNRGINNTMNKIHKRALRMVYNDDSSSYNELLLQDNTFIIHQNNLQKLVGEILSLNII